MKQIFNNNENNAVKDRIFTPLYGVKLQDGLFCEVFHKNFEYLKKIDVDAALYWFRKKAGKNAPGKPYRGHFEDNIKGQTAGMILMGAGNALRWEKNKELEDIVNTIVAEMKDCSEDDGYLMAVPKMQFGTLEYPHYVRIWLTYGLYGAALGGNEDALEMLRTWQDWCNQCDDLPIIRYTSLSFQGVVCSPFVYNTPIGKKEDIEVTQKYYEEDWRLGQFIMRENNCIQKRNQPGYEPHPHGTELEAFEGYLDLYRATGKYYYMRAVLNAYQMYKEEWQHVGGGIVMCEFGDSHPGCYWLTPPRPYNELCCTSFWILLNQRLHRMFPEEEKYVNEIETSLYNVAIANQDGEEGIRYFAWIDQHKSKGGLVHCCCGVGTRLFGMLPEFLYSVNNEELYCDIYNASEFVWEREEGNVSVCTRTKMPYDGAVEIAITTQKAQEFSVHLRIPEWAAKKVQVYLDGAPAAEGNPGSYVTVSGSWEGTHTVSFELEFALRKFKYTGAEQVYDRNAEPPQRYERYALTYGPLLMAVKGKGNDREFAPGGMDEQFYMGILPEEYLPRLRKAANEPVFEVEGTEYEVVPYFGIDNDTRFSCYPLFPVTGA